MNYQLLPTEGSPRMIYILSASPDGHAFQARVELRYLSAPDLWFLSIADNLTGETYVNQIPLICSYDVLNDLLAPFRYLFQGSGIGSFFCLKAVDRPGTENPSRGNLNEFYLLWGDRYEEE